MDLIDLSTIYLFRCREELQPPSWFLCLTSFNHLSLVFNASINFLIYFSLGKEFKSVLVTTIHLYTW